MIAPDTATGRVVRSYGPLALGVVIFLLMAIVVEPATRERQSLAGSAEIPIPGGVVSAPGEGGRSSDGGTRVAGAGGGRQGGGGGGAADVGGCGDRDKQVPGDPYSPPCYAFSGDNGGETSRGVTSDEIVISARELEGPTAAEIFADISGENVSDSETALRDTVTALAEYFSTRFQFYGRKLRVEFFKGQGNGATELLGGGREKALSDSVEAAKQIGAFADITGITLPYADALARQKVVNIGAPYPSRRWFDDRRPYAWSLFPDGTHVVEASSSAVLARLTGEGTDTAEYAGEGTKGKKRKYAVVAPENAEYQESVKRYIDVLGDAGFKIAMNITYKLDISSMPNQASGIIAQLKDAGITSVLCGCDPVMLALGLTPKSNEQSFYPEWLTAGLAFVEQDIVSQLIEQRQWARAFGIAYNAESEPQGRSYPYAAYKKVRPNDEPAFGVEEIYYQLYMLSIGLHMAGPNLTPETFEAGMYAYPGGFGPRGTWGFGPGDHTPIDDFREIWWDTEKISPQNNKPGAWVELNGGKRYRAGEVPKGKAPFFER